MGNKLCTRIDVNKVEQPVKNNEITKYLYIETYKEISKEPNNAPVIPDPNLEELRNTPPIEMPNTYPEYKSFEHRIFYNDKERKIVKIYKSYDDYICPICKEKTIRQVLFKLMWKEDEHIIKNGAIHYHCRRQMLVPCKCKNGHLVKLVYQNKCECGWPYTHKDLFKKLE